MWGLYQVIIVIILTNILIAMMTTTYTNISKSADTEWKYSKSFYQVEFLASRAILPPPFRLQLLFKDFMILTQSNCLLGYFITWQLLSEIYAEDAYV